MARLKKKRTDSVTALGSLDGASTTRLCEDLLKQWDPMFFETVDPTRMRRLEAIIDILGARFRGPFKVLDVGAGPGPLATRILRRFPRCRVVALDTDPVLVRVGEEALHRFRRRSRWILADLRENHWSSGLPIHGFDVAVSSLALHWLEEDEIRAVYRDLRRLLRPGGLLINGDYLPTGESKKRLSVARRGAKAYRETEGGSPGVRRFKAKWEKWWEALAGEPSMRAAFRERRLRLPGTIPPRRTTGPRIPVKLESHETALRDAGFREIVVVWQEKGFRILIGVT